MNASSKPFPLSFSTSFFAISCFLEAKTWIVYAASSVVATGFVTAGSSAASRIFGVSTMEVSDFGTSGVFGLGVSFVVSSVFSGEADFGFSGVTGSGFSGTFVSSSVFFFKSRSSSRLIDSCSLLRSLSPKNFRSSSDKGFSAEISVSTSGYSGGRCMLFSVTIPR